MKTEPGTSTHLLYSILRWPNPIVPLDEWGIGKPTGFEEEFWDFCSDEWTATLTLRCIYDDEDHAKEQARELNKGECLDKNCVIRTYSVRSRSEAHPDYQKGD